MLTARKKALMILGFIVLLIISLGIYGSITAKKMIEEKRHDIVGLALDIGGYDVGFLTARLKLKDIKIYPSGKEEQRSLLASARSLSIRVAPFDLLRGRLHARKVVLERPTINYIITGRRSANWDALKLGQSDEPSKDVADDDKWKIIVDKVEIDDGNVSYRNEINGQHLDLKDVDISVEDIRLPKKPGELPTDIELDADVGESGGKISVNGKADLLSPAISFDIEGKLSSTPITAFSSFYSGQVPFRISSGSIAVSSKAKAVNNALSSSHHATISGLKASGGLKGELMNKFLLSHTGPISVDVAVNGDLSTGDLSVSTALSKNIADEILKKASESVPEAALEKVKQLSPVKDIKNLFKR